MGVTPGTLCTAPAGAIVYDTLEHVGRRGKRWLTHADVSMVLSVLKRIGYSSITLVVYARGIGWVNTMWLQPLNP